MTLIQIPSNQVYRLKNMATSGRGRFASYGFSEIFKILLLKKYVANFQIKYVEMYIGDPLSDFAGHVD